MFGIYFWAKCIAGNILFGHLAKMWLLDIGGYISGQFFVNYLHIMKRGASFKTEYKIRVTRK